MTSEGINKAVHEVITKAVEDRFRATEVGLLHERASGAAFDVLTALRAAPYNRRWRGSATLADLLRAVERGEWFNVAWLAATLVRDALREMEPEEDAVP